MSIDILNNIPELHIRKMNVFEVCYFKAKNFIRKPKNWVVWLRNQLYKKHSGNMDKADYVGYINLEF